MNQMTTAQKYAQPEVVDFWKTLSQHGLQKCEQEMVERYLPLHGRLLDVGCGAGRAVLALDGGRYQVTGVDLSLSMLAAGRGLSAEARLSGANLLGLPFADRAFEAVFMFFGALQHIPGRANRRQAMAEMARVTRPKGRLILGLDNVAPALICYFYWFGQRLLNNGQKVILPQPQTPPTTAVDSTLWRRESRQTHPFLWHARGLLRTLRWRTWPGLADLIYPLRPNESERGDIRVAQFALPATPGYIYYHLYQTEELLEDAASAGWRLLGHHSGSELNEGWVYPEVVRSRDKQQFFAFEKV